MAAIFVTPALPMPSPDVVNRIENLKRRDLLRWLGALFEGVFTPDMSPEQLMERLQDGVILCRLANLINPKPPTPVHDPPADSSEIATNIDAFIDFASNQGLAGAQLCTLEDISEGSAETDIHKRESRVTQMLLSLGLLSNSLGHCPELLEVGDLVEEVDEDRKIRSSRVPRPAHQRALTQPAFLGNTMSAMDLRASRKISIRHIRKDKSLRFSLSANKSATELLGADEMTPEQLEELHAITGGSFGVPKPKGETVTGKALSLSMDGKTALLSRKRASRLPPQLDRSSGLSMELSIATLARDVQADEITLYFTKSPPFASTDMVMVDDELMEVRGVMSEDGFVVMVERGKSGTKRTSHLAGTTVTVHQREDDRQDNDDYRILRHRAIEEDFDEFEQMDFIELLEDVSEEGGHTFVYVISDKYDKAKNMDQGRHNDDRLLAYLINRLDLIVTTSTYSILYFHSADAKHQLDFSFLSKLYTVLQGQYKDNLQHLWVVHPTMWVKMAYFFCAPFMDTTLAAKVVVCESVDDLYEDFEKDGLPLPAVVLRTEAERKRSWF
eukprot:c18246_g1_i1.p1 GENE.c18246_g1_i1~~c18246_g1_i1.p1  ORF type:complete len:556 (-),score=148.36 c18246_g1_i1:171-1838(-)